MTKGYDRMSAARCDLDLLASDLLRVSAGVAELATSLQRNPLTCWLDVPPGFPSGVQDAAARLVGTLQALLDAGADQPPDLAFSAVAQFSALREDVAAAVAALNDTGGVGVTRIGQPNHHRGAYGISGSVDRAGNRLWSLISHLVRVKAWSMSGQLRDGRLRLAPDGIAVTFGEPAPRAHAIADLCTE